MKAKWIMYLSNTPVLCRKCSHLRGSLHARPAGRIGQCMRDVHDRVGPLLLRGAALPEHLSLALRRRLANPCCVLAQPVHVVPA